MKKGELKFDIMNSCDSGDSADAIEEYILSLENRIAKLEEKFSRMNAKVASTHNIIGKKR